MARKIIPILFIILLLYGCAISPTATAEPTETPLIHIKLATGYTPNIQYAPFFLAIEKGYFRDAGIELELDYDPNADITKQVGENTIQFGIASGDEVLLARAQGLPVIYIATWYQKNPIALVSMADLNIKSPTELRGKKIGLTSLQGTSHLGLRTLLYTAGIRESNVTLDPIGFNQVSSLSSGRDDIVIGYAAYEPVILRSKGYAINEMRIGDYIALAPPGIITNDDTLAQNPALVRSFLKAFLRGLQETIREPETAYDISKKYLNGLSESDPIVQKQILGTAIEQWRAPILGQADPNLWRETQNILMEMKLYSDALDLESAYTNSYLPSK